jgi:hypothetical protein
MTGETTMMNTLAIAKIDGYKIILLAGNNDTFTVIMYDGNGFIVDLRNPRTFVTAEKTFGKMVKNIMARYK